LISSEDPREGTVGSCRKAAADFTGLQASELEDELSITPLIGVQPGLGKPRCEVAIVAGQPLIDTLRRLDNDLLPRRR